MTITTTTTPISWLTDLDTALSLAGHQGKLAFLNFSMAPRCVGSVALERDVYLNDRVSALIGQHFVPVRMLRSESLEHARRLNVFWTPTFIVAEADGAERHRVVGYLALEEFLPQIELGLAKVLFARDEFGESQCAFEKIVRLYPGSYATPEADYWAGVSRYKQDKDRHFLRATSERLRQRYPSSQWTARASCWAAEAAAVPTAAVGLIPKRASARSSSIAKTR